MPHQVWHLEQRRTLCRHCAPSTRCLLIRKALMKHDIGRKQLKATLQVNAAGSLIVLQQAQTLAQTHTLYHHYGPCPRCLSRESHVAGAWTKRSEVHPNSGPHAVDARTSTKNHPSPEVLYARACSACRTCQKQHHCCVTLCTAARAWKRLQCLMCGKDVSITHLQSHRHACMWLSCSRGLALQGWLLRHCPPAHESSDPPLHGPRQLCCPAHPYRAST